MASYFPAKKGVQYIFYSALVDSAARPDFKSNPTIAAGDFKVSIDGGTLANLATLPVVTPAASVMVKFTLSTSEMNGDNVTVVCIDAVGAEWDDLVINIQTSARQVDDLAWPTISGRSIDVTTTGEVGIDLDNVNGALGTANFDADFLTNALLADNVIAAEQIAANAIGASEIADGAIDAATFAAGAINAAAIAADAIGASELATDAVTEIQNGLATAAALTTIQADTDNIQTRLPAALVSGRMDSSVGAMEANVLTAAAINADAITNAKIADDAIAAENLATGAISADGIADGAIDNATLATDLDTYQAKVYMIDDDTGTTDLYLVTFFKNGEPIMSGITSPTIQVIKASDGTDLLAVGALSEIGALGMYKKAETTNRIVDGDGYIAKVQASIGGATRTWVQPVGRDD